MLLLLLDETIDPRSLMTQRSTLLLVDVATCTMRAEDTMSDVYRYQCIWIHSRILSTKHIVQS